MHQHCAPWQRLRGLLIGFFLACGCLLHLNLFAQQSMPEGMLGWSYYRGIIQPTGLANDPVKACRLNASNQMGKPLKKMRPSVYDGSYSRTPAYDCAYSHFLVGQGVWWYGVTTLYCSGGYSARWPGVCVKDEQTPQAPSCSPDDPGYALGDPVLVSSGANVQSETDYAAGPAAALQVSRTYRTLRQNGAAQSGGQGWSFWFDRQIKLDFTPFSTGQQPFSVTGTFGDGSYFDFETVNGVLISVIDKRDTVQVFGANRDELTISRADGRVDHFKNLAGATLLVSSHTREGTAEFYTYDAEHRVQTISDGNGRMLHVAWDGAVVASISGAETSVRYAYEEVELPDIGVIPGMARLVAVSVHDASGIQMSAKHYHYEDPRNRYLLTGVTDENGVRFATFAFNETGQVVMAEHANGAERYEFAYPDAKTRVVTDPLGTERTIGLVQHGATSWIINSESQAAGAGCSAGFSGRTRDEGGFLASRTDFNGHKICSINDPARGLETSRVAGLNAGAACPVGATQSIDAATRRTSTQWHPDWPLKTRIARANELTSYVYNGQPDLNGKLLDCAQGATLPNGKPIAVVCQKTVQTTTDANGSLGFSATPTGLRRAWNYVYNVDGQLLTVTGPPDKDLHADSTSYTYYADTADTHVKGDLHTATDGLGQVTEYLEYTGTGQATKIRRPDGQILTLHFDARQRLNSYALENGSGKIARTTFEYDQVGQLTRRVAPDGAAMRYSYDDAHRLTALTNGAGDSMRFTLDAMGNVTHQEVRDPSGALVMHASHSFDALNRKTLDQYGPSDPGVAYEFDAVGNLTKITDQLGRVTTREYDYFNRMIREVMPAPVPGGATPVVGFAYNHQDQLTEVTDPRKLVTRYDIDGFGQRTAVTSPDTGTTISQFDSAGKPISSRDARGYTTSYAFDAGRRPTRVTYADGTGSQFVYGNAGTGAAGHLAVMYDASGMTEYRFDEFGNVLAQTQSIATGPGVGALARVFRLTYGYGDGAGNFGHVTSMTYPSKNRIDIAYDTEGRVNRLSLTSPGAAGPVAILGNIGYVPFGPVKSWTWGDPAGQQTYARTFDQAGRMTGYPLGDPEKGGTLRTLGYDYAGNITATSHAGGAFAARLDQRFTYNGMGQLTAFVASDTSQNFSYDPTGNRTQFVIGASSHTNNIDSTSNRLISTSGPMPAKRNTFDASGNLSTDGTNSYGYSAAGRLASSENGGVSTRYIYNGFGQRVSKQGLGGAIFYIYDAAGHLLGEYDTNGKPIQETVYLGDLPVAIMKPAENPTTGSALYRVYVDHLQTPRVITRHSDGQIVWRWDSADPFGLDHPDENPSQLGAFAYNPRLRGQMYDKETNNHYNYFRDYDPQTGRYIQSDPIGLSGGINTYGYVGGNPINNTDPLGLEPPKPTTQDRSCTPDEYQQCFDRCKPEAVKTCSVTQVWKIEGIGGQLVGSGWRDTPPKCTCATAYKSIFRAPVAPDPAPPAKQCDGDCKMVQKIERDFFTGLFVAVFVFVCGSGVGSR